MSTTSLAAAGRCLKFLELPKGLAQPSVYQRYWVRYAVLGALSLYGVQFMFRYVWPQCLYGCRHRAETM